MTREAVLDILQQDRVWSLYAICDLQPGYFEFCRWFARGRSIGMLFEGCEPPIFFALGAPDELLPAIDLPLEFYLHVPDEFAARIARTYAVRRQRRAIRMALNQTRFSGPLAGEARRLTAADMPALIRLYANGEIGGESPDFFFPDMVTRGCFVGAFDENELIAVAGTHVVAASFGAAAIGNVYTHREHRGRGLAAMLTSQVAGWLIGQGISTIGLNVYETNLGARRIYERIGFELHCIYSEGIAKRIKA